MPVGVSLLAMSSARTPHPALIHRQKKPRSSRDRIGAEEGTVEEPSREGDQTFVLPAESSVPTLPFRKLAENDLFIGIAAIATKRPCRHLLPR
ncbi:hypothetical protein C1X35_20410 [Pseudomonas sp. FW306-1C-G01A]|nr:hypothetical protein [Pseudomonas sp.]MSU94627.1 hypothetical protein [Pseudomonas mandelii]PMV89268.1 hypothetical protein C1X56_05195 [Pseudomonas sp. GW101-1A09]PMV92316.1 hypothetical protein C1X51_18415 [Pseudomonas sp. FW306-2-2C-B10A]PMV93918.1 hypothetical protein C1X55_25740 [Pseudomonas sp. GW460-C8]PMW08006.1 hypothetical protein C1X50_02775 [Pseudomonas sp. MPR-TSA4]PMW14944.1 hypothetical protein C1X40_21365 [Pseudomonas sp. GW456-11-11-14-TSB2]PMW20334.1 hypothetical protein